MESRKTVCNPGKRTVAQPREVAEKVVEMFGVCMLRVKPARFTVTPVGMRDP